VNENGKKMRGPIPPSVKVERVGRQCYREISTYKNMPRLVNGKLTRIASVR